MGLLDQFLGGQYSTDPDQNDAARQGLLAAGLGLLSSKGRFASAMGQAGQQGMGAYQGAQDAQQARKLKAMQMQQMTQDAQRRTEEAQRKAQMQQLAGQFYRAPSNPGMDATGGADTAMSAPQNQASQGGFNYDGYANAMAQFDPMQALQIRAATQKDDAPVKLGAGEVMYSGKASGYQKLMENPKEDSRDPFIRMLEQGGIDPMSPHGQQLFRAKLAKDTTHAPGASVSINTGQKGFDNTLKLRGDFRSEPIYKAHQEVVSAHSQIQQSLRQESPAGDLAGATKLMKILDPGSVVRESELGMAMAATGLVDRLQNSAKLILTGQKLTTSQRADFQKLADALHGESTKQYNSKRIEYKMIADRNGLGAEDVVGPEGKSSAPAGWSIKVSK